MGLIELVRDVRAACVAINADGIIQPPLNLMQRDKAVIRDFIETCAGNTDKQFPQVAAAAWEAIPDEWLADLDNIPNTEDAPEYSPCVTFGKQTKGVQCKECGVHAVDEYLRCRAETAARKAADKVASVAKKEDAPKEDTPNGEPTDVMVGDVTAAPFAQPEKKEAAPKAVPTSFRSRYGHMLNGQVGVIDDMLYTGAHEDAIATALLAHFDTTEERAISRIRAHVANLPHSRGIQITITKEDGKTPFYKADQEQWCGSISAVKDTYNVVDDRRTTRSGEARTNALRPVVRKDSGEKPQKAAAMGNTGKNAAPAEKKNPEKPAKATGEKPAKATGEKPAKATGEKPAKKRK